MRAPQDVSLVMVQTARALGRRAIVSRGWADLSLVDNESDCLAIGEVNSTRPSSSGSPPSSITAARAPPPQPRWSAHLKSSSPGYRAAAVVAGRASAA